MVNGTKFLVRCESDDFYQITAEDESGEIVASYVADVDEEYMFVEDFVKYLLNRFGSIQLIHSEE